MRDSLETASETQPLYSSGLLLTSASMREEAAVTTPMCWSLSRWMMRDVHSPLGMMEGSVRNRRSRHSAADCFTTSRVSLQKIDTTLQFA